MRTASAVEHATYGHEGYEEDRCTNRGADNYGPRVTSGFLRWVKQLGEPRARPTLHWLADERAPGRAVFEDIFRDKIWCSSGCVFGLPLDGGHVQDRHLVPNAAFGDAGFPSVVPAATEDDHLSLVDDMASVPGSCRRDIGLV